MTFSRKATKAILLLVMGLLLAVTAGCWTPTHQVRILNTGDSLDYFGRAQLGQDLTSGRSATVNSDLTEPGTSLCDFESKLVGPYSLTNFDAVIVEDSGNSNTPCVQLPQFATRIYNDALVKKYHDDTVRLLRMAGNRPVFLVTAPAIRPDLRPTDTVSNYVLWNQDGSMVGDPRIKAMYLQLAQSGQFPNAYYIDAAQSIDINGGYNAAAHLPDGVHLQAWARVIYAQAISNEVKQHLFIR